MEYKKNYIVFIFVTFQYIKFIINEKKLYKSCKNKIIQSSHAHCACIKTSIAKKEGVFYYSSYNNQPMTISLPLKMTKLLYIKGLYGQYLFSPAHIITLYLLS